MTTETIVQNAEHSLNLALTDLITSTVTGAGEAKDFLVAEIPDVAQQALLYYGVYNFILFLLSLVFIWISIKFIKIVYVDKLEWAWNQDGYSKGELNLLGFSASVIVGISMLILVPLSMNLQWLKIWLAPKLWLIEYTASIVK